MAGKKAPPEMDATIQELPRLVWRPRPRIARVKISGKMQDSKNMVTVKNATPASPLKPMAKHTKNVAPAMKVKRMRRGLTNIVKPDATNRPMAKTPWPIAKRSEAAAWSRFADS